MALLPSSFSSVSTVPSSSVPLSVTDLFRGGVVRRLWGVWLGAQVIPDPLAALDPFSVLLALILALRSLILCCLLEDRGGSVLAMPLFTLSCLRCLLRFIPLSSAAMVALLTWLPFLCREDPSTSPVQLILGCLTDNSIWKNPGSGK